MELTKGPIFKVLMKLALPIMASAFLATAYNITDMAWIGMLGAKAVAGVGVGGMYAWLASGLASLARVGGQVHVAQAIGRENKKEAVAYAETALQITLILGIGFGILCFAFSGILVDIFGLTNSEAILAAEQYMKIACGLIVFSFLGVTLTGLYTAQGDSKTPLIANFIGLVMNMILDPLLILGIGKFQGLGVIGAAVATVFAQMIVVFVLVVKIYRKNVPNLLKNVRIFSRIKRSESLQIITTGGPIALQSMLYCGISMILTGMVSGFGEDAVAVQRVGGQIESLSWNMADGFGSAMNAFAAQNYGAAKKDRIKKGYRISALTVGIWGAFVGVMFLLFPEPISQMFFHEQEAIRISVEYLKIIGVGEAFMCIELLSVGAISGMGNTRLCSIISVLLTGMRIPLAYALSRQSVLGLAGIWWALTISSIFKGIAFYFAFRKEVRR